MRTSILVVSGVPCVSGNPMLRVAGTAVIVGSLSSSSTGAELFGTHSPREGSVQVALINGNGPRACVALAGRFMKPGTRMRRVRL